MKLRERDYSTGNVFYPFKKLPIELRHIIWRCTLRPRIVEIQDRYGADTDITHAVFGTATQLPTAFYVSRDSRSAVISLYPHIGSQFLKKPSVRFNSSIDTLYIPSHFDIWVLQFLEALGSSHPEGLQRLAISEEMSVAEDVSSDVKFWRSMQDCIKRFSNLRELIIALEIWTIVDEVYYEKHFDHYIDHDMFKPIMLFDEIPSELCGNNEMKISPNHPKDFEHTRDWRDPKPNLRWLWRFKEHPEYV
jgi:hypothetical protein